MDLAPTDLAYAAGVVDSDGYIGVHRNSYAMRVRGDASQAVYTPRVQVKQVTPQAVDLIHNLFGGHRMIGKPSAAKGRPLFAWAVHSAAAGRVCEALIPFLRIKSAQAENVLEVCRINANGRSRTWEIPEIVEGEPLLPLLEAARQAGRSAQVAYQSAHLGNIPCVRKSRRVFVPASFVPEWADRGAHPRRNAAATARLEECFRRAKELNRVGVQPAGVTADHDRFHASPPWPVAAV
ncbi:MAG TPA: hypothetical protein VF506_00860 [Streptosporangiaceae bacterium]